MTEVWRSQVLRRHTSPGRAWPPSPDTHGHQQWMKTVNQTGAHSRSLCKVPSGFRAGSSGWAEFIFKSPLPTVAQETQKALSFPHLPPWSPATGSPDSLTAEGPEVRQRPCALPAQRRWRPETGSQPRPDEHTGVSAHHGSGSARGKNDFYKTFLRTL